MRKPVNQVPVGTPVRFVCKCGSGLPPVFLTEMDIEVGTSFGTVCEVEIVTAAEVRQHGMPRSSN